MRTEPTDPVSCSTRPTGNTFGILGLRSILVGIKTKVRERR